MTGASSTEASNWLEEYEWKLEEAIDAYTKPVKKVQKIDGRLEGIFDKYKEKTDGNRIDVEGTIAYLEDLGINPEDLESLTLSFFLRSPSMGCFNRENFLKRWQEVGAFTVEAMAEYIKRYNEKIKNSETLYYEMYNFAFDFLMTVEGQKLLDNDLACEYWDLLLLKCERFASSERRIKEWIEFINKVYKRAISRDTWQMFYLFVRDVVASDPLNFKNYDEMAAWPSVIDEYVEYLRENGLLRSNTEEQSVKI